MLDTSLIVLVGDLVRSIGISLIGMTSLYSPGFSYHRRRSHPGHMAEG